MIVDDKLLGPYDRPFPAPVPRQKVRPAVPPAGAQPVRPDSRGRDGRRKKDDSHITEPVLADEDIRDLPPCPAGKRMSDGQRLSAGRQVTVSGQRYDELLEKEQRLRRLEELLGRLCEFSVLGMKEGRIRYSARISKREAESLLWELLRRHSSGIPPLPAPMRGLYPDFRLEQVEVGD
jgi:hypothetical protein